MELQSLCTSWSKSPSPLLDLGESSRAAEDVVVTLGTAQPAKGWDQPQEVRSNPPKEGDWCGGVGNPKAALKLGSAIAEK